MEFLTAYALLIVGIVCLFVKIGFLLWAYVKTRKPAAIAYGLYLLFSAALPVFILPLINPDYFALYQLVTIFIETLLFVWLLRSLIKRPVRPLPHDA